MTPWHRIRWIPFLIALPVALALALVLVVLRAWSRPRRPDRESLPPRVILYMSHPECYLHQVSLYLMREPGYLTIPLGDQSFLSYTWFFWHWWFRVLPFRVERRGRLRPSQQIVRVLSDYPNHRMTILSDSRGPYGIMRPSLVRLAVETNRPLLALRMRCDRYITIHHHKIPLPFARIEAFFSDPIPPEKLAALPPDEALALVQSTWASLA